jgi:hypothetical protein
MRIFWMIDGVGAAVATAARAADNVAYVRSLK